jgi:hypothetical protein
VRSLRKRRVPVKLYIAYTAICSIEMIFIAFFLAYFLAVLAVLAQGELLIDGASEWVYMEAGNVVVNMSSLVSEDDSGRLADWHFDIHSNKGMVSGVSIGFRACPNDCRNSSILLSMSNLDSTRSAAFCGASVVSEENFGRPVDMSVSNVIKGFLGDNMYSLSFDLEGVRDDLFGEERLGFYDGLPVTLTSAVWTSPAVRGCTLQSHRDTFAGVPAYDTMGEFYKPLLQLAADNVTSHPPRLVEEIVQKEENVVLRLAIGFTCGALLAGMVFAVLICFPLGKKPPVVHSNAF